MDKTESTVRIMLTVIEAPLYDVGVLSERGMLRDSTASRPRRSSTGFLCSSTAMPTARISTFVHRGSIVTPLSMILARPRLRGSRLTALPHVLLSRPAPATFKPGSSTPERFRSSSERSPRKHWPSDTMPIPARRIGGGLDGFPASRTANQNTEDRTGSSLSCAYTATAENSTRWRRHSSKR